MSWENDRIYPELMTRTLKQPIMESKKAPAFVIECLDHVALRVADINLSRQWYESVLGLTSYQLEKWGEIPVFLMAGTTGIALFPANLKSPQPNRDSKHIKLDHFAFRLSNEDFANAREHYESLGISYEFQDHHYFHSIYTRDPDGHNVELTTLVVEVLPFYNTQ